MSTADGLHGNFSRPVIQFFPLNLYHSPELIIVSRPLKIRLYTFIYRYFLSYCNWLRSESNQMSLSSYLRDTVFSNRYTSGCLQKESWYTSTSRNRLNCWEKGEAISWLTAHIENDTITTRGNDVFSSPSRKKINTTSDKCFISKWGKKWVRLINCICIKKISYVRNFFFFFLHLAYFDWICLFSDLWQQEHSVALISLVTVRSYRMILVSFYPMLVTSFCIIVICKLTSHFKGAIKILSCNQ